MWKAFLEMEAMGWINGKRPRMVAVQAAGCAPTVRAFQNNRLQAEPWQEARTVASGLRVPRAIGDFLILRALRESKGTRLAVDDAELLQAIKTCGRRAGGSLRPEGG